MGPQFFILGTQRSGTTLLRLILNSHKLVSIPEEASFLKFALKKNKYSLANKNKIYKYLINDYQLNKWNLPKEKIKEILSMSNTNIDLISNFYSTYKNFFSKKLVGDKTPPFIRYLSILNDYYPEAKYIFIVRDGRDSFLSLRNRNHHSAKSFVLGGLEWKIKNCLILKNLNNISSDKKIIIKYEDLIKNPQKIIIDVCGFLNIEFQKDMLQFWKNSKDFIDKNHSSKIFKPIDSTNLNKWKIGLTDKEIKKFQYYAEPLLKKYDYEIKKINITLYNVYLELITFLFIRLAKITYNSISQIISVKFGLSLKKEFYE